MQTTDNALCHWRMCWFAILQFIFIWRRHYQSTSRFNVQWDKINEWVKQFLIMFYTHSLDWNCMFYRQQQRQHHISLSLGAIAAVVRNCTSLLLCASENRLSFVTHTRFPCQDLHRLLLLLLFLHFIFNFSLLIFIATSLSSRTV